MSVETPRPAAGWTHPGYWRNEPTHDHSKGRYWPQGAEFSRGTCTAATSAVPDDGALLVPERRGADCGHRRRERVRVRGALPAAQRGDAGDGAADARLAVRGRGRRTARVPRGLPRDRRRRPPGLPARLAVRDRA